MIDEQKDADVKDIGEVDFTTKAGEKKIVKDVKEEEAIKEEDKKPPKKEEEVDDVRTEEEKKMNLPFPEAAVVRLMKKHLDKDKMIRKEVKIAMNKWLGKICEQVSKEMNKFPYVMINLHEFNEGKRVFDDLENFHKEKERILAHLNAIKKDIEKLERDLGKVEKELIE